MSGEFLAYSKSKRVKENIRAKNLSQRSAEIKRTAETFSV